MNPHYHSHPLEAFRQKISELDVDAEVHHTEGCSVTKWLPLAVQDQWSMTSHPTQRDEHELSVFKIDFFASAELNADVCDTQYRCSSNFDLTDSGPSHLRESGQPYSLRITSFVTPQTSGKHMFGITNVGHARLWVDGVLLVDNYSWTEPGGASHAFFSAESTASLQMCAGQSYLVVMEAASWVEELVADGKLALVWSMQPSVRLGFREEQSATLTSDAVTVAKECGYTVRVIGLNDEWEGEGYDRKTMALPLAQDELLNAMLEETGRPESIVVVNQSGSAVEMPWESKAHTILQAWYGGQEAGNALADVLLRVTSRSGRPPITWLGCYDDLHFSESKESWPGVDGDVHYTEGVDIGYRWYLKRTVRPLW